ncbi:MAG: hypothetical protein G01um101425_28 [Candidatus Peregrinibacteria bacterium Gr01-1014_25]|nr:MAG: hypothetical protein G01um101425_28 [Candidatus Peregrinibacteria bacterium Gr01-1014_25]
MDDTSLMPARTLRETLRHAGMPFFLFSATLLALVLTASMFLLPLWQRVPLAGKLVDLDAARQTERSLQDGILALEDRREQMAFPQRDGLYVMLRQRVDSRPSWGVMHTGVLDAADRAAVAGIVHVATMTYDADGSIEIGGSVRGAGVRSLTVLAGFVDALKQMPGVAQVHTPDFTRIDDPELGILAPFTIRIAFDPPASDVL